MKRRKNDDPTSKVELGWKLYHKGSHKKALEIARKVLQRSPDEVDALRLLGRSLVALDQPQEGLEQLAEAIKLAPDHILAKLDLVAAQWKVGQKDQALKNIDYVVSIAPDHVLAHEVAGDLHRATGNREKAAREYAACAELTAGDLAAQKRLAQRFEKLGFARGVAVCAGRVAKLAPDDKDAHLRHGIALEGLGQRHEAIEAYRLAIAIDPRFEHALYNLGRMLNRTQQHSEAIRILRRCLEVAPGSSMAYNMMGLSLVRHGRIDEAIAAYRAAIERNPRSLSPRGNLLFASCYDAEDGHQLLELHRDWARHITSGPNAKPYFHQPPTDGDADRPLRIGYVSPDFRTHVVARFLRAPYEHHDHERFHIVSYYTLPKVDAETPWFKERSDTWRQVHQLKYDQLAKQVNDDRIDILVDLTGFAGGTHMPALALRPAPVQATYLGYPASTGLETIDARFTDSIADPPGTTEAFHTESLVRLDPSFLCYSPWPGSEEFPTEPDDEERPITFGSFNNFPKLRPKALELWARVLKAVPGSRLLLKARSLADDEPRQLVLEVMDREGIERDRIEFLGNVPGILDHLRLYSRIDIGLDPLPYNGTTTTCEALWMGVPVVTLAGKLHAGRVGASILTNVGLPDLVADSPERYVEIAGALAADRERLRELRANLRRMMLESPLMDGAAFTRRLEDAYRTLWAGYLERAKAPA